MTIEDLSKNKNYIFKYMPYNVHTLELLINSEFYLGAPDKLNDPNEGDFVIENFNDFNNKEFFKRFCKMQNNGIIMDEYLVNFTKEEFDEMIQDILPKWQDLLKYYLYDYVNYLINNYYGSTSFSRTPLNFNMWSHYADSHKGLCLVFNKKNLEKNKDIKLDKVIYGTNRPSIKLIEDTINNTIDIYNINKDCLLRKTNEWKKEKELRFIYYRDYGKTKNRKVKFNNEALVAVFFGLRMEYSNEDTIIKISNKINYMNLFKCTFNDNKELMIGKLENY